ncbi:MAG: hypothetical protein WCH43_03505 [Verrucomicrobiota bacterium]
MISEALTKSGFLGGLFQFSLCSLGLFLALVEGKNEKGDADQYEENQSDIDRDALSVNFSTEPAFGGPLMHFMPADFTADEGGRHENGRCPREVSISTIKVVEINPVCLNCLNIIQLRVTNILS